jgi:hypothetical protein
MKGDGGEKDLNRMIRIVMLTSLIAVTLGMTNFSTVFPAKPTYTVTVTVNCSIRSKGTALVSFWPADNKKWTGPLGDVEASCIDDGQGTHTLNIGTAIYTLEPVRWGGSLHARDLATDAEYCFMYDEGTTFPADRGMTCLSPFDWVSNPTDPYAWKSVSVTISEIKTT